MFMFSKVILKFRHPPSYQPQPRTLNIKPEERQSQIIAVPGISNVLKYVGGKSKNYWMGFGTGIGTRTCFCTTIVLNEVNF